MHGVRREDRTEAAETRVKTINRELRRLKAKLEREGLGEEEKLGRLLTHAEGKLRAVPGLSDSHRFSWVSGEVEKRLLSREEV